MYLNHVLGAAALGVLVLVQSCGGNGGQKQPVGLLTQKLQFIIPGAAPVSFHVAFSNTSPFHNPCVAPGPAPLASSNNGSQNIAQCAVLDPAKGLLNYDAIVTLDTPSTPGGRPSTGVVAMHVRSCNAC